jgi:RHS repeat-associated protein
MSQKQWSVGVGLVFSLLFSVLTIQLGARPPEGLGAYAVWFADSSLSSIEHAQEEVTFFVKNNTGSALTPSFSCGGTEIINCVTNPASAALGPGEQIDVIANFTSGNPTGSAQLDVTAFGGGIGGGSLPFAISTSRIRVVVPGPYTANTQTVHRSRPVVRADFVRGAGEVTDTSYVRLWWRGSERTTQIRRSSALLEWEVGAADSLVPGDSAQLKIQHCLTSGMSCQEEIVYVKLPNDQTPVVDFTGMPLETNGGGFAVAFGAGISVNGAEVETGFSTPSYVSMGVSRGVGLQYSTRSSYPRALVAANIKLPWPAGAPDQLKAVLFDGATRKDSLVVASPSCLTGSVRACRVVLQADYSAAMISGGVSRRWLAVEVSVTSGGTTKVTTDSVEVLLVDRRDSPYGSGWWPTGASRLYAAGQDRLLVTSTGTATLFRGSGDSVYLAPPGATSRLVKVASGWELRPRGTTAKVVFDANGRYVRAVDASGNRDSIAYDGSGRVATLVDPIGKTITFHYGSVTQKLDSIVTLPGSSGKRTTRITIDTATNQLRYDSLSSPAARPVIARYSYLTYGSVKGTAQLRTRAGRYGSDSVMVLYDSTSSGRPLQARILAATAGGSVPVLGYRAAELQGWKSFRSLDSVYVETTDPLGRWTRSRLGRWGQGERSWDQMGLLALTAYDDVGRMLWSEGKNGDSSRVYTDYDQYGRIARTYIRRSVSDLHRIDSLVYDANSRVVKRIDSRGKVDSVAYDAAGRPIYHRDPALYVTRTWYKANGQVDSVLLPNASAARRMYYDGTWSNTFRVRDESGLTVDSILFDNMGRVSSRMNKLRVQVTATTTKWQWRRVRSWLDVAGRPDSIARDQTLNCNDPCNSPGTFSALFLRTTKYTRDSLGLVSTLVLPVGSTTFLRDRLGRVIRSTPPGSTGSDSMVHDLAGNVTKTISRNGDTVQTWFDTRNRSDSASIPRYGVVHRTYGGPQDQLTRVWVTGFLDSLGGVNPNRSYVFDARGRLTADTLWTGPIARVTAYGYDDKERPDTTVDALGSWVTKYETDRGIADTLISAFGDTIVVDVDGQGRITNQTILRGSTTHAPYTNRTYSGTGELSQLSQSTITGGGYTGFDVGTWMQGEGGDGENLGITLLPTYTKQDGGAAASETQEDSLGYDAYGRLLSWRGMRNDTLLASEDYSFDTYGNVTWELAVFQAGTNRLTSRSDTAGNVSRYSYDNAGNLTQRIDSLAGALTCTYWYAYDGLNRLVSVRGKRGTVGTVKLVSRYAYDVDGNRIARRVYNGVFGNCVAPTPEYVRYAVRDGQVQFETDSAGSNITRRYLWGSGVDDLIAVRVGSSVDSTFYAGKDKLGSIRAWVRKDGAWRWGARYRPYGRVLEETGTPVDAPYRWTGREYDPETGFYFHRARYYDPSAGRFIQEDPIGLAGGENLYAYVDGHPLEMTDPSGLAKGLPSYTFCSITSGACLSWTGEMYGGMNDIDFLSGGSGGGGGSYNGFQAWTLGEARANQMMADMDAFEARMEAYGKEKAAREEARKGKPLTPEEKAQLGNLCSGGNASACDKIRVRIIEGRPRSLGSNISLNVGYSLGELAHEVFHYVDQYQRMGMVSYYLSFGALHLGELLFGTDLYSWTPGQQFREYGLEQQGQIVQDCYNGSATACDISPYDPGT